MQPKKQVNWGGLGAALFFGGLVLYGFVIEPWLDNHSPEYHKWKVENCVRESNSEADARACFGQEIEAVRTIEEARHNWGR